MILYTVQEQQVVDILLDKGIVFPDKSKECPYFKAAYDWMRSKMVQRNLLRDMSEGMFWAHSDIESVQGYEGVLITLEIDDSLILPSEYNYWHSVLNRGPIVLGEGDEFDRKYDCIVNKGQKAIQDTWDLCIGNFKDGQIIPRVEFSHHPTWQYTFAYICKDCVKDICPNKLKKEN